MAMENNQGPYFVFLSLERMTSSKGFLKQPIMFLHRSVLRLFYLQCVKYICSVLVLFLICFTHGRLNIFFTVAFYRIRSLQTNSFLTFFLLFGFMNLQNVLLWKGKTLENSEPTLLQPGVESGTQNTFTHTLKMYSKTKCKDRMERNCSMNRKFKLK